jgi:hypothetical protein
MEKFYRLRRPKSQWGDYSRILIHGMSCHLSRKNDVIQLERTGPYIPPISFPGIGDVVVTDAFRRQLESSALIGLRFQPVIKERIVHLDWQTWDLSGSRSPERPEGGEPEGYILDRPHSPEISDKMGELWELAGGYNAKARKDPSGELVLIGASWQGTDFFRAEDGWRSVLVSESARAWILEHAGKHAHFIEVPVV